MPAVLDAATQAFLRGGISIIVATRDAAHRGHLVRAVGCRIDDGVVTIFLAASQSGELLADLRGNGRIAVVFSEPSTHRTVQLKGLDAAALPLAADDHARVAAYRDAMVAEIARVGFGEAFTRAMLHAADDDLIAVRFTPSEAFSQTPGPQAGEPLRAA